MFSNNSNSNSNSNNNDNNNERDSLYKINKNRFWTRAHALHSAWTNSNWQSCDSILVICGKNDNIPFKKNNSLHLWLFGIQLLSSIMIITPDTIHVCCGDKTLNVLSVLGESNGDLKLNFIIKDKSNGYESNYKTLIEILKTTNNGKSIGYMNESQAGKFVKNFVNLVIQDNGDEDKNDQNGNKNNNNNSNNNFEIIDYSSALSSLTMIKDDYELSIMKRVGEFASNMFVYSRNKIEKIVERDQTKKHNEIAEELIQFLDNSEQFDKLLNKNKAKNSLTSHASFKKDNLEVCYQPVIQSGGKFKLKIKETSESDEQQLYYNGGCVVVMIGFKLKDYCVNIGRTLYFDATKEQKEIYNVLLKAFKKGLITLRNNVQLSNVYNAALKVVKGKKPELEKNFLKNCGWGIGLELRDKNYVIDKKSTMVARTGMTFNFQVGFENLVDSKKGENGDDKASHYSVIIADTVIVTEGQMEWITKCDRHITDYEIDDPNEVKENDNSNSNGKSKKKDKDKEKEKEKSKEGQSSRKRKKSKSKKDKDNENDNDDDDDDGSADDDVGTSSNNNKSNDLAFEPAAGRRYVTRHSNAAAQKKREENQKARQEREKNQEKLRELKRKRLDKLFRDTGGDLNNKVEEKEYKDPNCYNDSKHLPGNLNNGQLHVDFKNECLICPIMEHVVPFHASTIKNYSLQQYGNIGDNGDNWTYLTINFVSPIDRGDAMFIKQLSYRSMSNNLATVSGEIELLQKEMKAKAREANEEREENEAPKQKQVSKIFKLSNFVMKKRKKRNKKRRNGMRWCEWEKEAAKDEMRWNAEREKNEETEVKKWLGEIKESNENEFYVLNDSLRACRTFKDITFMCHNEFYLPMWFKELSLPQNETAKTRLIKEMEKRLPGWNRFEDDGSKFLASCMAILEAKEHAMALEEAKKKPLHILFEEADILTHFQMCIGNCKESKRLNYALVVNELKQFLDAKITRIGQELLPFFGQCNERQESQDDLDFLILDKEGLVRVYFDLRKYVKYSHFTKDEISHDEARKRVSKIRKNRQVNQLKMELKNDFVYKDMLYPSYPTGDDTDDDLDRIINMEIDMNENDKNGNDKSKENENDNSSETKTKMRSLPNILDSNMNSIKSRLKICQARAKHKQHIISITSTMDDGQMGLLSYYDARGKILSPVKVTQSIMIKTLIVLLDYGHLIKFFLPGIAIPPWQGKLSQVESTMMMEESIECKNLSKPNIDRMFKSSH